MSCAADESDETLTVDCPACSERLNLEQADLEPFNPYSADEGWFCKCGACDFPIQIHGFHTTRLEVICRRNVHVTSARQASKRAFEKKPGFSQ